MNTINDKTSQAILQALTYECPRYLRLPDYRNLLLVCREWRIAVLSNSELARKLKRITYYSSSLVHGLINRICEIDRSNSPKYITVVSKYQKKYPVTQKEYEIWELEKARYSAIYNSSAEVPSDLSQPIENMNDQERNALLDAAPKVAKQLISSEEINLLSIKYLLDQYDEIQQNCPELETIILNDKILPRTINNKKTSRLLTWIISILILISSIMIVQNWRNN